MKDKFKYGTFFERLLATIVDNFIIGVLTPILLFLIYLLFLLIFSLFPWINDEFYFVYTYVFSIIFVTAYISFMVLYYFLFVGLTSTTPGKKIMGLKIVDPSGKNVGWKEAFLREILGVIVSTVFIYPLGFLWLIWDKKSQTWHDKIANTFVIHSK